LVEHSTFNRTVAGSNPAAPTILLKFIIKISDLAVADFFLRAAQAGRIRFSGGYQRLVVSRVPPGGWNVRQQQNAALANMFFYHYVMVG
jgi:hypothetical protein